MYYSSLYDCDSRSLGALLAARSRTVRKSLKFTTLSEWICFETRWLAPVFRAWAQNTRLRRAFGVNCARATAAAAPFQGWHVANSVGDASPLVVLLLAAGRYCRGSPLEEMAQRERAIYCQRVPPPPPPCSAAEFRNHGPDGCSGAAGGALLIPRPISSGRRCFLQRPVIFHTRSPFPRQGNPPSH
ncbi:hypothetical protein MTO96_009884 [Rhipicephalus appendiculatus]